MNTLERILALCKSNEVSISKLEQDLNLANGYITYTRKKGLPSEVVKDVANYFHVTTDYLITGANEPKQVTFKPIHVEIIHLYEDSDEQTKKLMLAILRRLYSSKPNH